MKPTDNPDMNLGLPWHRRATNPRASGRPAQGLLTGRQPKCEHTLQNRKRVSKYCKELLEPWEYGRAMHPMQKTQDQSCILRNHRRASDLGGAHLIVAGPLGRAKHHCRWGTPQCDTCQSTASLANKGRNPPKSPNNWSKSPPNWSKSHRMGRSRWELVEFAPNWSRSPAKIGRNRPKSVEIARTLSNSPQIAPDIGRVQGQVRPMS